MPMQSCRAVDDIADIPILTIRYRQTIRYRLLLNLSMPIAGTISAGFKFDDITTHDIVISYRHRHIFPLNHLESERALIEQPFYLTLYECKTGASRRHNFTNPDP
jgi:hypothetical protein